MKYSSPSEPALTYFTPFATTQHRQVWMMLATDAMDFHVRACQQAEILLSKYVLKPTGGTYEVHLGSNVNEMYV